MSFRMMSLDRTEMSDQKNMQIAQKQNLRHVSVDGSTSRVCVAADRFTPSRHALYTHRWHASVWNPPSSPLCVCVCLCPTAPSRGHGVFIRTAGFPHVSGVSIRTSGFLMVLEFSSVLPVFSNVL